MVAQRLVLPGYVVKQTIVPRAGNAMEGDEIDMNAEAPRPHEAAREEQAGQADADATQEFDAKAHVSELQKIQEADRFFGPLPHEPAEPAAHQAQPVAAQTRKSDRNDDNGAKLNAGQGAHGDGTSTKEKTETRRGRCVASSPAQRSSHSGGGREVADELERQVAEAVPAPSTPVKKAIASEPKTPEHKDEIAVSDGEDRDRDIV